MKPIFKLASLAILAGFAFISCTEDPIANQDYSIPVKESTGAVEKNVFADGVMPGKFSTSPTTSVQFSQGNLQFNAVGNTWCFADNQYDFVGGETYGLANGNNNLMSSTYDGLIDLFAWSGDGVSFAPYVCSSEVSDYKNYTYKETLDSVPSKCTFDTIYSFEYTHHLDTVVLVDSTYVIDVIDTTKVIVAYDTVSIDEYEYSLTLVVSVPKAAWGSAPITNASASDAWRCLTSKEWEYILTGRANAKRLCAAARVGDVNGVLIFPDDAVVPSSITTGFSSYASARQYAYVNNLSVDELRTLEQEGAVFLPAAGNRKGNVFATEPTETNQMSLGCYWAANSVFDGAKVVLKDEWDADHENVEKTKEQLRDEQLEKWDKEMHEAYDVYFLSNSIAVTTATYDHGASVRLVKDVK